MNNNKEVIIFKKIFLPLLVLFLAVGLVGCGGSKESKKNSNYKEASVSNQVDYEMTISYPKDFKESDDKFYASGFYTNIQSHKYVGEEYSIGLGATTIGSYDKTVDNLINKKRMITLPKKWKLTVKKSLFHRIIQLTW